MVQPLIQIKNLTKDYQNDEVVTPVLQGISFNITKGEFVAIMGPSGSGKSTIMHILGFLDRPTSGQYIFKGEDTSVFSDRRLALIRNQEAGFVFQSFFLLSKTTVLENVKLPLIYSNKSNNEEKAKKALEAVGLSHRLKYFSNQLSGGKNNAWLLLEL